MKALRRLTGRTALLYLALAYGASAGGDEIDTRIPVPDAAGLTTAERLVRDVFAEEYATAKTDEAKSALAKKVLTAAVESTEAPAEQYVLFRVARDIAAGAGDAETGLAAAAELGRLFRVDVLAIKAEVLETAVSKARLPSDHRAFLPRFGEVFEEAITADRFELAKQMGRLASSSAVRARDVASRREVATRMNELERQEKAYAAVKQAIEVLGERPHDPEANLLAGEYRCFLKGDWEEGLPMLAIGSDSVLRSLAVEELAGVSDSVAQSKLGDGWWDLATKHDGITQKRLRERATYWYRKALPGLSGFPKTKVEKRIGELVPKDRPPQTDLSRLLTSTKWVRKLREENGDYSELIFTFNSDGTCVGLSKKTGKRSRWNRWSMQGNVLTFYAPDPRSVPFDQQRNCFSGTMKNGDKCVLEPISGQ